MKKILVLSLLAVAGVSNAQLFYTGGTAGEDFDMITTSTVNNYFSTTVGQQSVIAGSTFEGTKIGGTGTAAMNLIADAGVSATGAIHSLGQDGSSERALGLLASGTNIGGIGVNIVNASGSALASMTVSFKQENWRTSTSTLNIMAAAWGRTGGGMTATDFITSAAMTPVNDLDLVGPSPVASNGALNGNDPINRFTRSHTFTFATPLGVGESLYVRWLDVNDTGNDASLALDECRITAEPVPEPATLAALGLGTLALVRRRRAK
ncbi:MAG: PEP-CTERM sorting domain-containing protein [Fimbriimonadaceae bacterium]|nr:PEP-CTERM sorting domain-containing protein [Fimbriimonadaceae bacterium]